LPITTVHYLAAAIFAAALIHTFSAKYFESLAHKNRRHGGLFHLLGEVEVIFGLWAGVLVLVMAATADGAAALKYAESRNYTEPLFVFVVMVVAASKPIVSAVIGWVDMLARWAPMRDSVAKAWLCFGVVPLAGSLITEPAAMTIAALMMGTTVFRPEMPQRLKYLALGVLFVNISVGGTLTSYAAPPVLMVANTWGWDSTFMLTHFGWKSALAVILNASIITFLLRAHLGTSDVGRLDSRSADSAKADSSHSNTTHSSSVKSESDAAVSGVPVNALRIPHLVTAIHLAFLVAVVVFAHHPVVFLAVFLFFIGFTQAYSRCQSRLIIKEALLVGFFLAGLVVLGGMQQWWLQPIVSSLSSTALFFSALGLTAITDNAALTYLGSLIEGISAQSQYMLVAGAVAGGGLTVIANAPNPAGVALLRDGFTNNSISMGGLFAGAIFPTAIAAGLLFLF
jgi:hypothetical protein